MAAFGPIRRRTARVALLAMTLSLVACGGSTALRKHCCYIGDVTLARVGQVEFVAPDSSVSKFADIYPGFEPQDSFLTTAFPFRRADNGLIIYDSLVWIASVYDANKNGFLEEPEITVLYLREGAIGMGHKVDHLTVDGKRADAITTSASDVGGLMHYLKARQDTLTPEVQAEFRDMELLGQDIKLRGSEGPDRQKKWNP